MSPILFFLPEEKGLRGRPFQVLFPAAVIGLAVCFTFLADQTGILLWWEAAIMGGTLALLIIGLYWSIAEVQRVNRERARDDSDAPPEGGG